MPDRFHLRVEQAHLFLELAAATGLEHAAVNYFDLLHRLQLHGDVLEQLASEEYQLLAMLHIHGQGRGEDVKPHAVDDLGHVARPVSLIHGFDLLLAQHLLVHGPLGVLSVVLEAAWRVVQ